MNSRNKAGLQILKVALFLGVLGDILLRTKPWGLNVLLFNLAFAGALIILLRRNAPERLTMQTYSLLAALVFFASMFVWRDAIELRVADTIAILTILGVLFLPTLKITAKFAGIFQYAVGFAWAAVNSLFAPVALLAADIRWNEMQAVGWRRHLLSVVRGMLIAAPLLLIFGALFVAADAVYEGWIRSLLNVDFENLFSHGALFAVFAWLTAGYFRGLVFAGSASATEASLSILTPENQKPEESKVDQVRAESGEYPVVLPDSKTVVEHINISDPPQWEATDSSAQTETDAGNVLAAKGSSWSWAMIDNSIVPGFTLGAVEIGVVLGLINLLFLSFVIVQVPYLFGGMELVQNTPDFKLADYARRGFGELVAVAFIVLPVLLGSHWLIKKETPGAEKLFRILAGIQIALLFVIMASAVQRIVLLTGDLGYGLTTVRLYPLIFITWLAIVFLWFVGTVLRGARRHFAWGALWSAFFILAATHVLNPDALIVRTNIALMQQGREFDAYYNSSLSDDSLPPLFEALPEMSLKNRCEVGSAIHYRYRQLGQEVDLRSWNLSRRNAWAVLRANDALLHQTDGCPEQFSNDKDGDTDVTRD
ncbi:MAG: DUF4173 domain-containing protein [Pyrinomonadaceae bacterium]